VQSELLHTSHSKIVADDEARVVTRERTGERFESLDAVEAEYEAIVRALDLVPRESFGVIVDLRRAPPRNDEAYEEIARRYNARLYGRFRRVAVLVQTAAGKLQLHRFLDATRPDARIFDDESEARAFLSE
jgi:hypothetical protein